ncbi:MAG: HAMP domain-containing sensor histidine kinase [Meiothermus sp.]|nr:HAMP domain-containing sensor histidine kinase [Meiothermus sp.]
MTWRGGFRARLQLGLVGSVLLTALLVGGLGAWQFQRSLERTDREELTHYTEAVAHVVVITSSGVSLDPDRLDSLPAWGNDRFRVVREGQVYLEVGGRFPDSLGGWLSYRQPLEGGYVLEAARSTESRAEAVRTFWQTELLALPLALLLALGASYLLLGYLLSPVRRLTKATHDLAQQRFPEPLPVPPGDDELSDLAQSFNRMSQAVRNFLERERSFARYTSHELRTPLATLRAQIESLEQGLLPREESLPAIKGSLERLEKLLAGLLALTRSPQSDPTPVALADVLERVLAELPGPQQGRVTVGGRPQSRVLGYEELLHQALGNLIHNALKYSQGLVEVEVGRNLVAVRDSGPGVPEEALARLGDPFLRLQPRTEGLGLGLALVRHIAQLLGGELSFRNRPQGGLEAVLTLPPEGDRAA